MPRTEKEILQHILKVECQLSPENLTCDGEASKGYIRQKAKQLNKQRQQLVRELGREPSLEEIYQQ